MLASFSPSFPNPAHALLGQNPLAGDSSDTGTVADRSPSAGRGLPQAGRADKDGGSTVTLRASPRNVFERIMNRLQEQMAPALSMTIPVRVPQAQSAETTANNILGFIEKRLMADAAGGADVEALQKRLEQGLSGFKQGFGQAQRDLDSLGMRNPELDGEISDTYDRVLSGIDELQKNLSAIAAGTYSTVHDSAPVKVIDQPVAAAPSSEKIYQRYDLRQANSFSFSLTTADGDTVTIEASQRQSLSMEEFTARPVGSNGLSEMAASYFDHRQEGAFDLKVEGHLDDKEMAAIEGLLSQVGDLSEQFFAGDLGGAFGKALAMGYDSSEITAFSLNLRQTSVQRMQSAYQEYAPGYQEYTPNSAPAVDSAAGKGFAGLQDLSALLHPLGRFVTDLTEMNRQASEMFPTVNDLIKEMAGLFERPEQPSFRNLLGQLLGSV